MAVILANPLFILATTIGGPIMEEFVFRYAFIHLIQPLQISGLRLLLVRRFFTRTCRWSLFVYFFMGFFFALCTSKLEKFGPQLLPIAA